MKTMLKAAVVGAMLAAASPAMSADLGAPRTPFAADATSFNPWMIRLRGLVVLPSPSINASLLGAPVPGAGVAINTTVVPELDITYFFTRNLAVELILGVTPHTISGRGALAPFNTPPGNKLGSTWLLPPTLMFQYHFTDFGAFKPYVGAGLNYTFFFSSRSQIPGTDSLRLAGNLGFALQAGFDYMIDRNWGINVDVKKVFLDTAYRFTNAGATVVNGRVRIDPWLISTGVVYKF